MQKWQDFTAEAKTLASSAFVERHSTPVLVLRALDPVDFSEAKRFKTLNRTPRVLKAAVRAKIPKEAVAADDLTTVLGTVFPVKTTESALDGKRVTLGRTKTNDVILPYPLISKLHAYITWPEGPERVYFLTDAGTTNGTAVHGTFLTPGVPVILADNNVIEMGPVRLHFMLPLTFYKFVCNPPLELAPGG